MVKALIRKLSQLNGFGAKGHEAIIETPSGTPALSALSERISQLPHLSPKQIDELHFDLEATYRQRILASSKGSTERQELFSTAYRDLTRLLLERRSRFNRSHEHSLGFSDRVLNAIRARIGPPPARLLDVGCGTGVLVERMALLGYAAEGIDLSDECIRVSRARTERSGDLPRGGSVRLICGNFLVEDFTEGAYDLIHSNDVLEHLHPDEVDDFIAKCHRLLKPGGALWLTTPNKWTGPGDATILRFPPGTETRGLHLREYSLRELDRILRKKGFVELSSLLLTPGRLRGQGTSYRPVFHGIKFALEGILPVFPHSIRSRTMWAMAYAEVLAFKPKS